MSAEERLQSLQGLKQSSAELVTHMQCISQKMEVVNEQMEGARMNAFCSFPFLLG
jgi:hypothetical protein